MRLAASSWEEGFSTSIKGTSSVNMDEFESSQPLPAGTGFSADSWSRLCFRSPFSTPGAKLARLHSCLLQAVILTGCHAAVAANLSALASLFGHAYGNQCFPKWYDGGLRCNFGRSAVRGVLPASQLSLVQNFIEPFPGVRFFCMAMKALHLPVLYLGSSMLTWQSMMACQICQFWAEFDIFSGLGPLVGVILSLVGVAILYGSGRMFVADEEMLEENGVRYIWNYRKAIHFWIKLDVCRMIWAFYNPVAYLCCTLQTTCWFSSLLSIANYFLMRPSLSRIANVHLARMARIRGRRSVRNNLIDLLVLVLRTYIIGWP